MRRFFTIILSVALFLFIGGYSALWFYHAFNAERLFANYIEDFNSSDSSLELTFSDIDISGFPFSFKAKFSNGKLVEKVPVGNVFSEFSYPGDLALESDVFNSEVTVAFPDRYNFVLDAEKDSAEEQAISFAKPPVIKINMQPDYGVLSPFYKLDLDLRIFLDRFISFSYVDKGMRLINIKKGDLLSSYDSYIASVKRSIVNEEKDRLAVRFSGNNIYMRDSVGYLGDMLAEGADKFSEENSEIISTLSDLNEDVENSDFNIKFVHTGTLMKNKVDISEFDLDITQIAYVNSLYSINSDGRISASMGDVLPYGWFRINIKNYEVFLEHILASIRLMDAVIKAQNKAMIQKMDDGGEDMPAFPEESYSPFDNILGADVESVKNTLLAIGDVSEDEENFTIVFARDKGGEFYVGKVTIEEALLFFQGGV